MQTESVEWICNNCGGTGKVKCPANKMQESILIVCSHCSTPSAYGWCAENGVGDEIAGVKFLEFPKMWQCEYCGSKHKLSKDFYETPITFTPKHFVDLKQLQLERDVKDQKHIPAWVRNLIISWGSRRRYLIYAMVGVLLLFVTTFAIILFSMYLGVCNSIEAQLICSNTFFVSIGLLGLLILMFFLNPVIEMFLGMIVNIFLVIYKLKKLRE